MDKAFEPKLFKSVLGLEPGSLKLHSPIGVGARTKNLIYLNQLASTGSNYGVRGPAFTFQRQALPLVVTDNEACFPEDLGSPIHKATVNNVTVYYAQKDLDGIAALLLSGYDPTADLESIVAQWKHSGSDAPPETRKAHVTTKSVDVGLINFIRTAGRRLDVFSYALAPSEPDELTAIQAQEERNRSIVAQAFAPVSGTNIGAGGTLAEKAEIQPQPYRRP